MAERYSIDGQILTDMADAIRNSRGEVPIATIDAQISVGSNSQASGRAYTLNTTLPQGKTYKLTFTPTYCRNNVDSFYSTTPYIRENSEEGQLIFSEQVWQNGDSVEVIFTTAAEVSALFFRVGTKNWFSCDAGTTKLELCDANGNLLGLYTPQQMVDAVSASLPTADKMIFSGELNRAFAYNRWNWVINAFGNQIQVVDATGISYMFSESNELTSIPFDINTTPSYSGNTVTIENLFYYCKALREVPKINNLVVGNRNYMICNCWNLRTIPDDWCDTWDWSLVDGATSAYTAGGTSLFMDCYSLRSFPEALISHYNPTSNSVYNILYNYFCCNCHSLDAVNNLFVSPATLTSNCFNYDFMKYCSRLKSFTFAPYEGTVNWSNQTIPAQMGWGYILKSHRSKLLDYNSGITTETEVVDDATYQALKDNPDWWTQNEAYSRYNHDSAVETINSLPATTGTGCQIIFDGSQGSATDGGAIETLTEEEIAVAAAKGWTVALQ